MLGENGEFNRSLLVLGIVRGSAYQGKKKGYFYFVTLPEITTAQPPLPCLVKEGKGWSDSTVQQYMTK
jgi:hypothetical protein